MLSLQVVGGIPEALKVASQLRFWRRATSLGGVQSLVEHRAGATDIRGMAILFGIAFEARRVTPKIIVVLYLLDKTRLEAVRAAIAGKFPKKKIMIPHDPSAHSGHNQAGQCRNSSTGEGEKGVLHTGSMQPVEVHEEAGVCLDCGMKPSRKR